MKDTAYLVIHGFAGGPHETAYPVQFLRSKGLDVHPVALQGHGGTRRELSASSPGDWIRSVENAVTALEKTHRHVTLIGFSMGGLIALRFLKTPSVNKLALINTPVYYWHWKVITGDVFDGVFRGRHDKLKFYKDSMAGSSLKSDIDFLKVLSGTKKQLRVTEKPVLIVQCLRDETVRPKSARLLQSKLGPAADARYYDGGRHLVFMEESQIRDEICRDMAEFLKWQMSIGKCKKF